MRKLLLVQTIPMELRCSSMAFDGQFFYICQDNEPVVHRLDLCGNIVRSFPVKQCFWSICYDSSERCFWGITYARLNVIIKLSTTWKEIRTIGPVPTGGVLNHIAYNAETDELLLNSNPALYRISKQGVVLSKHNSLPKQLSMTAGALEGDILRVSNSMFKSPDMISLVDSGAKDKEVICLPEGHRCCSFCPFESPRGEAGLYLLTSKGTKLYLLKYLYLPAIPPRSSNIKNNKFGHDYGELVCIQEIII